MEESTGFSLLLELCLCYIIQRRLLWSLPLGCRVQYVSGGPKIRFNMAGRCLRPWSVKAGQTSELHSPDALGDLEGWQGLKSTEGQSFKCNGFQWLNVSPFSLREMSPRCNAALSPVTPLFKSFTCHMEERSQTQLREKFHSPCACAKSSKFVYICSRKLCKSPKHNNGNGEIKP